MNEKDILALIAGDSWRMGVLRRAEKLQLPQWAIGAGFVRNIVWDHLHHYTNATPPTDIDLIYFDPSDSHRDRDQKLAEQLKSETGCEWEIVNEARAYEWNHLPPYTSMEDVLLRWPETATGIAVRLVSDEVQLIAPNGIDDLVNLIVRPCPLFPEGLAGVEKRMAKKQWLKKWPLLKLAK